MKYYVIVTEHLHAYKQMIILPAQVLYTRAG
jgi:hypothetical protein